MNDSDAAPLRPGPADSRAAAVVEVIDRPEERRFVGLINGRRAGFLDYRRSAEGIITFLHTEVDPASEGKGVGGALARAGLDEARARGVAVVVVCPFVAGWIERHREYADLVHRPNRSTGSD